MEENGIRINKFLSEAGYVPDARQTVRLNLEILPLMEKLRKQAQEYCQDSRFCFRKESFKEMILIAFHKPVGIVCTAEKREKNNVIDYINYPKRIYPVGRLDKDSEGLLLLTNNGDIVNKMMRSGNMHEKEYIVTVNRPVTESFIHGLANGVPLAELNTMTRKCHVKQIGKKQFKIILTQGLNRQIRRMCEYFGYRVEKLVRTRIMNIELGDLPVGTYRDVTPEEYRQLLSLIKDSSNETVIPKKYPKSERMKEKSKK